MAASKRDDNSGFCSSATGFLDRRVDNRGGSTASVIGRNSREGENFRMSDAYNHPALRQLKEQQARFAPKERRLEQIDRAEKLLAEIDVEKRYPYEYLVFRITGFRPEGAPALILDGTDVRHDLRLFVENLSETVSQKAELAPEPVLTVEAVGKRFNVSTRTVTRWRRQGLVARRFVIEGRTKVGIPGIERVAIRRRASRSGRARLAIPPVDRCRARRDHPPRPQDGGCGGTGQIDRDRPPHRPQDGPLHGNDPRHAQGLRPRSSRSRDLRAHGRPPG